ncbi:MAG: GIY-YIG nuclease family protein [Methylovulum sp.]|nr:GIY-YIG nuclease family protein [Methylovulum sp.]
MNWSVYIILCMDDSLYTGITTNVSRRFAQHASQKGAKYFRGRQPKQLVYVETGHDRSSASKREMAIKKLNRLEKLQLVSAHAKVFQKFPPPIQSPHPEYLMKFITKLTLEEKLTLTEAHRNHPSFCIRQRAHALLLNDRGYLIPRLGELLEVQHETVNGWLKAWETDGLLGLYDRPPE